MRAAERLQVTTLCHIRASSSYSCGCQRMVQFAERELLYQLESYGLSLSGEPGVHLRGRQSPMVLHSASTLALKSALDVDSSLVRPGSIASKEDALWTGAHTSASSAATTKADTISACKVFFLSRPLANSLSTRIARLGLHGYSALSLQQQHCIDAFRKKYSVALQAVRGTCANTPAFVV